MAATGFRDRRNRPLCHVCMGKFKHEKTGASLLRFHTIILKADYAVLLMAFLSLSFSFSSRPMKAAASSKDML